MQEKVSKKKKIKKFEGKIFFFGYNEINSTINSILYEKNTKSFQYSDKKNLKIENLQIPTQNYLTLYLSTISFDIKDISMIQNFYVGHYSSFSHNLSTNSIPDLFIVSKEENTRICQIKTPNYLEGLHIAISLPSLSFYLLFFGLCLLFHQKEPMKSRSLTPMIFLLLIYSLIFSQLFFSTTTIEWREKYFCLIYSFFDLTFKSTCFFLIFLHYMKFILKNLLYQKKNEMFIKIKEKKKLNLNIIKLLNFLVNDYFIGVLTILFIFFFWFISIFYAIPFDYNGTCISYHYQMNEFLHFIVRTIISILIIGIQALDLFFNFDILKEPYKYFVDYDPFYFRIQLLPFPIFCVYFLISEIILYFIPNEILQIIFHSISIYILLIIQCLFPLIITIIKYILFNHIINTKNYEIQKLPTYLNKVGIKHHFEKYCQIEWNLEYLYLWQSIKDFEKLKTAKEFRIAAFEIQKNFLEINQIFSVNINQPNKDEINNILLKNEELNSNSFSNICKATEKELFDSFFRFSLTKEFKNLGIDETLKKQSLHLLDDYIGEEEQEEVKN